MTGDIMRRFLDNLYLAALWISALCLCAIAGLVGLQLAGRMADVLLSLLQLQKYGFVILSLAEIAGYLLAASSFFALAATLKSGVHIRVTMVLSALNERARRIAELWAFGASTAFCAFMTWHITSFAWFSFRFGEVSPGVIRVPLVIPQAAMAAGIAILTIAFIDEFFIVWRRGSPTFRTAEDAITLGKEG
jgi:TRAP-type C4-dicarboxylate transport system permease small subunit